MLIGSMLLNDKFYKYNLLIVIYSFRKYYNNGGRLNNLRLADDTVIIADDERRAKN